MNRYSVRPARLSDIEAVYEIIVNQDSMDYGDSTRSLEDLQNTWQSINLDEDTCIAFKDGRIAGYAELQDNNSPFIYLAQRNNVDLAFQLLIIMEDKAVIRNKGPVHLFTRISVKNNTLTQLFASKGYKSNLSFQIMELILTEPPASPIWPSGITVRAFIKNQDETATYHTDEQAGQDKGYHTPLSYEAWVKRMGMDKDTFDPELWFLACDGEEVVGVALNLFNATSNTGWVDHLSVKRLWRNQGIGKALLLHTFHEFYRRGVWTIKLSVDSRSQTRASHLYESVGMKTTQEYYIYRRDM